MILEQAPLIEVVENFNLDKAEAQINEWAKLAPMQDKLTHRFTPGLYVREIFMPAGTLVTTKIHKTEHPFVISKGRVSIWTESDGVHHLEAPHTGITKPGTRRLIYVHEDTIWTTFHVAQETDIDAIEARIIEPYTNPFLIGDEQMKELTQ